MAESRGDHLERLASLARRADEEAVWPGASWAELEAIGGLRWCIPKEFGGDGLSGPPLLERYEALAGACLTTGFLLSQRDAACRRLLDGDNERIGQRLLPELASGKIFATVGLAQLTTSRQYGKPPVTAQPDGADFIIDGVIPWVTGAAHADFIVVGAVTDAGQQILGAMPTDVHGLEIGKPLELMALEGSLTSEVRCHSVRLSREFVLAGPMENVLAGKRGGAGGLETSCLALGLIGAAVRHLLDEAKLRPPLGDNAARLQKARDLLRLEMMRLAEGPVSAEAAQGLRARANALVLRATQAALAASKGTGFLREHPAQRWARQALFFLVWSCPWPVTAATMEFLSPSNPLCA